MRAYTRSGRCTPRTWHSIHRLARWKEQVRQRFAARTPVNQWTQQLLAVHLDVLAPGGETDEVAVEVDADETCRIQ